MFCSNCGAFVPDNSRFCENCGCAVTNAQNTENYYSNPASNNPYAEANNNFYQPQNNYYAPQTPAEPVYQPQQNFPNTPPQYLRPVQTPYGVQYIAENPMVSVKKPEPKYNPFVFVSAGIAAALLFMCFCPWFTVYTEDFNLFKVFSENIYLEKYEMDAMAVCSFLIIIAIGFLIPSLILTFTKKNQMPIGFSIASSVIILFTLLIFVALLSEATPEVMATIIPAITFVFSIANIVFPAIARKHKS